VGSCRLIGGFVVAGAAARFAVHEPVVADADVECGLAEATIFIALALTLGHFALCAAALGLAGSGGHKSNLSAGWLSGEYAVGNVSAEAQG
jgi:hypothetical protein